MTDATLTGVARTLRLTLRGRAEEHVKPDALFSDPIAAQWLALLPADPAIEQVYSPAFQHGVAAPARCYDDVVRAFLSQHTSPCIVELGAGLSTRCYRLGLDQARWVELDLPPVIALRHTLDVETPGHRFVAAALDDKGWLDQLPQCPAAQTLFVAEGVLPFLPLEAVQQLFAQLQTRFAGAMFAFDVIGHDYNPTIRAVFAQQAAPLQWSVGAVDELSARGLRVEQVQETLQMYPERWRALGLEPNAFSLQTSGALVVARVLPHISL